MQAIFLSASIPVPGRGNFYESASPFLIQCAVQEFLNCALGRRLIVWGGHPAITPMVWAACESLGVSYAKTVVLYQSEYFVGLYPRENDNFASVIQTPNIEANQEKSLRAMREAMLGRSDLVAAVFIGGMEGVIEEYRLFTEFHPSGLVVTVPVAGGAARELAIDRGEWNSRATENLDFAGLFHRRLAIRATESRSDAFLVEQQEQFDRGKQVD